MDIIYNDKVLFQVEEAEIKDIFEFRGEYYRIFAIWMIDNHTASVKKINYNLEGEKKEFEQNIICPYCNFEDIYSLEFSKENGEEKNCSQCNSIFKYEKIVTIDYNTYPVKPAEVKKIK
jgi:hypothetical protein